jgi:hypothetical protein
MRASTTVAADCVSFQRFAVIGRSRAVTHSAAADPNRKFEQQFNAIKSSGHGLTETRLACGAP